MEQEVADVLSGLKGHTIYAVYPAERGVGHIDQLDQIDHIDLFELFEVFDLTDPSRSASLAPLTVAAGFGIRISGFAAAPWGHGLPARDAASLPRTTRRQADGTTRNPRKTCVLPFSTESTEPTQSTKSGTPE